jgi:methoxymalonate biosynthesis acyl carrier protein
MNTIDLHAVAEELERFVRDTFHVTPDDDLFSRQVHLYQEGYVDSAGVVETIAHLEQTWGVSIPPTAVFDPRFTHIDGIAQYIVGLVPANR